MIIRIAVVEDEESYARTLEGYINKFAEANPETFIVETFADGEDIAANYKSPFDIIFLDIRMKRLDGIATAKFIRELDKDVNIIFVTNLAQYAIKGYSVGALDFLLKPVTYFAFSELLKKVVEKLKRNQDEFILLRTDAGVIRIGLSRIIFIESFDHKMVVHTSERDYTLLSTMSELESKLSSKNFFRCSKSYLINMAYVEAVKGYSVKIDKYTLTISRLRKKAFMEALTNYVDGITR